MYKRIISGSLFVILSIIGITFFITGQYPFACLIAPAFVGFSGVWFCILAIVDKVKCKKIEKQINTTKNTTIFY